MSLELKIESLTAAINTLIDAINKQGTQAPIAPMVAAPAPVAAPIMDDKSKQMKAMLDSVAQMPTPAMPAMPAPPTFMAPVAAPAPTGAPFSDPKGLIEFVMTSYKNLGPTKGAGIQGVLTGLGYQNINDVKAEHYAALFFGIEALK
jgi:hypothetical protein